MAKHLGRPFGNSCPVREQLGKAPGGSFIEYVGVPRKDRGHAFQDVIIIIIVRIVDEVFPIISRLPSFLSGVAIIG